MYDSPPAVPFWLSDRSFNLSCLLNKLNERPYDCRELAEERLLSYFGLSPRTVPLQEPLDIMFGKHLRDEHRAATIPPATKSSRGPHLPEINGGSVLLLPWLGPPPRNLGLALLLCLLVTGLALLPLHHLLLLLLGT
ncbi:UNVERIFIED_CONTAM: hypothetical protein Sradi_3859700 [Sesamum radiatum]|uniref:Uncharacterized protein n=1 Tax=Sesamum radiatum TaxID=300843 RepID=A0AAW2Q204_SESRA